MKTTLIFVLLLPVFLSGQSYGIGVILGSPTGFTGKMLLTETSAIAVNAGWSFWPSAFHVTGDYQFLFPGSFTDEDGRPIKSLIPYVGLGGRMKFRSDDDDDDDDFQAGVRFGGGLEYLPERFGVFIELYPVVNLVPSTKFAFEGGLGFRLYF